MSRANPTRFSSLKGKEKDVSKKCSICVAPLRPKPQRRLEDRELNQARSKPNVVNRPVRTARIFVHHYNSTHYCNTETVSLFIFPFLQTNITSQMWPTGGMGEWKDQVHEVIECLQSSNFRLICVLICAVGAEDTEMVHTNPVRVQ